MDRVASLKTHQISSQLGSSEEVFSYQPNTNETLLLEFQALAPAPSQSFYHLSACNGRVTLRDWPRKRHSQKWTRESAMNPSEKSISFQELIQGEWKSDLVHIFGDQNYQKLIQAANASLEGQ
jgi:hypothetical protein